MSKMIIQCPECQGTGLYKGMAEKGDCAVVCYRCNGTGSVEYNYTEFTGKKLRADTKRVFKGSFGYVHSDKNVTIKDVTVIRFEDGGCTYEEWLNGAAPKPVKELYCPYQWDNRGMGNEPLEECRLFNRGFGSITNCAIYKDKHMCWENLEKRSHNED